MFGERPLEQRLLSSLPSGQPERRGLGCLVLPKSAAIIRSRNARSVKTIGPRIFSPWTEPSGMWSNLPASRGCSLSLFLLFIFDVLFALCDHGYLWLQAGQSHAVVENEIGLFALRMSSSFSSSSSASSTHQRPLFDTSKMIWFMLCFNGLFILDCVKYIGVDFDCLHML